MKHFFYKFVLFSALFLTGCLETPQADAGSNQTVNSGQKVILDGSGSVGELLLYHWEQTKGTSVILDGVDTDKAIFVAPTIDKKEMLVFTLTVQEEGKKEKSTDSVSIIIEPNTVDHPLSIAQQFTNLFERGDKNKFGYNTTAYLDDKEKRGLTVGIIFTTGANTKDFCKFSDAYDVIKKYAEMVEDVNAETFAFKEVVNSCDKSDFDNIDFADINKTWHDLNDSLFYRAQDAILKKTTYTPALDASKKLKGSLLTVLNLQNAYVLHGHGEDENSTDGMIGIASADDAFYEFEGEDDEKEWLGRFLNARWVEFCGDDEHRKALSILSTLEKLVDEYDKYHDLENNFMDRVEQLRNHYEEIYADENNVLEKCRRYQSSDDSRYLYQNDEIKSLISDDKKNIAFWMKNGKDILSTTLGSFFKKDKNNDSVGIVNYAIEEKIGGFDVVYTIPINNYIAKESNFISLQIPGVIFQSDNTFNILNPKFKHYLETRNLNTEKNYLDANAYWTNEETKLNKSYFPIAHQLRIKNNKTYMLDEDIAYGTQFVYSPTIVATDTASDLTVGTSLNSNFIKHQVGAKMYIDKNNGSWTYRYDLIAFKDLSGGQELKFTIPVRFAKKKNWIFTLYPYKEFFSNTYVQDDNYKNRHPKDVNPIQAITFSFPNKNSKNSPVDRNWAPGHVIVGNSTNELNLKKVLDHFGKIIKDKGYKRSMIWNFTGTYSNWNPGEDKCFEDHRNSYHGCMYQQLPFQFLGNPYQINENALGDFNFSTAMKNVPGNTRFEGIDIGYDWGISGQVPVKENGYPINKNTFRPHHLATFNYHDKSDDKSLYAHDFLDQIASLNHSFFQPKFLRLDALNRMQNVEHRLAWLNAIKEKLPDTKLAPESSIDYMHAQASMINQLDSTDQLNGGTFKDINQPDFLAMYLNPGMENIVNLDNIFTTKDYASRDTYVQALVKLGYTPLVKYNDKKLGNMLADLDWIHTDELVDVHGLNNTYIDNCLNNDGVDDWPYNEACRNKDFSQ